MRKLKLLFLVLGLSVLSVPIAYACDNPECVCDCNSKCLYGENCKVVKECKLYKSCVVKKVCSDKESKCCSSKKEQVCHIPPGNPANAHTICVGKPSVKAHLDHGDYLGKCKEGCETRRVCHYKKCCKKVEKCECKKRDPKCPECKCEQDGGLFEDQGVEDQGVEDQGVEDQGVEDQGVEDQGVEDQGVEDQGVEDQGVKDAGVEDQGTSKDMEVVEIDAGECLTCPKDDLELVGSGCSVSGSSGVLSSVLVLGVILLFVGIMKRSKFLITLLFTGFIFGGTAQAGLPVNNFKTAPSFNDYYTTMNPRTLGHLDFNTQLVFNYSHKPLRVVNKFTGKNIYSVVRFRMNADLALSLGLFDWFELGVVVPTSLGQGAGNLTPLNTTLSNDYFERSDFKDLRIVPKVSFGDLDLFDSTSLELGFALAITGPTGDRDRLLGENGATLSPAFLVGLENKYFGLGLNAGVLVRYDQDLQFRNQDLNFSEEVFYGVGLNIPLVEDYGWLYNLDLVGDLWGSVQLEQQDKEEVALEAMGGLRAHLKHGVVVNVAAGGGLTKGYGVPEYRVMWGFGWEFDYVKPLPCKSHVCKPRVCKTCRPKVLVKEVPVVVEKTLVIPHVYFDTDEYYLRPDAVMTLDKTIKLLKENPWVKKVRLEGHCDHRMPEKYNETLSWNRVKAVQAYLVDHGVSLKRLEARAYGETQRVDTTKTEKGMQKNRRVEFHVVEVQ